MEYFYALYIFNSPQSQAIVNPIPHFFKQKYCWNKNPFTVCLSRKNSEISNGFRSGRHQQR